MEQEHFQEVAKGVIFCFSKHNKNWTNLYCDRFILSSQCCAKEADKANLECTLKGQ